MISVRQRLGSTAIPYAEGHRDTFDLWVVDKALSLIEHGEPGRGVQWRLPTGVKKIGPENAFVGIRLLLREWRPQIDPHFLQGCRQRCVVGGLRAFVGWAEIVGRRLRLKGRQHLEKPSELDRPAFCN